MSENSTDLAPQKEIGRNEPCPCGSGKKYKRCHGVGAAPKVTPPKHMMDPSLAGGAGAPGGFGGMFGGGMPGAEAGGMGADPFAGMDQGQMLQFAQALQRLPKGQLQKLQGIMQRAMAGKDVTREAAEFERSLPVEFQEMLRNFKMPPEMAASMGAGAGAMNAPIEVAPEVPAAPMTANDARRIVEQAVAEGKISKEQAEALLQAPPPSAEEATAVEASENAPAEEDKSGGIGKLWRGLTGKK